MYADEYFNKAARYMASVRSDIWTTEDAARTVLDNLCWEAKRSSDSGVGGYAATAGFTVTYDIDSDTGFGEFNILENLVSVWSADEADENRGFVWSKKLDSA